MVDFHCLRMDLKICFILLFRNLSVYENWAFHECQEMADIIGRAYASPNSKAKPSSQQFSKPSSKKPEGAGDPQPTKRELATSTSRSTPSKSRSTPSASISTSASLKRKAATGQSGQSNTEKVVRWKFIYF